MSQRVAFAQTCARRARRQGANVVYCSGQRIGHHDICESHIAGVGHHNGVTGDIASEIADIVTVAAGPAVEYFRNRDRGRLNDRRRGGVSRGDGGGGALLGRNDRRGIVLIGITVAVGVEVGLSCSLGGGVVPDFADIEHAVGIGITTVEAARLEHRNSTRSCQRVSHRHTGQRGFAVIADIDGVVRDIARAIDHRGRTGGVAAIGAVGDVDESLVDQNVRNRVMVADRIDDHDLSSRRNSCSFKQASGLRAARRNDFVDLPGAKRYAAERVITVGVGNCVAFGYDLGTVLDAVAVGVTV